MTVFADSPHGAGEARCLLGDQVRSAFLQCGWPLEDLAKPSRASPSGTSETPMRDYSRCFWRRLARDLNRRATPRSNQILRDGAPRSTERPTQHHGRQKVLACLSIPSAVNPFEHSEFRTSLNAFSHCMREQIRQNARNPPVARSRMPRLRSPLAWFLPDLFVCGGAQRSVSLATGTFTGESTRNPLRVRRSSKHHNISSLGKHDLGVLDSFAESSKSSLPNPLGQIHPARSWLPGSLKTGKCPGMGGVFAHGGIVI